MTAFDEAWLLVKAIEDANWGKPGQMMWWDKRYGGKMPDPVTYPWNINQKTKQFGPPRPANQHWGGGNLDIYDFMDLHENRDLLQQLVGTTKNPNKTNYPLEGKEIVPWSEFMVNEGIPESHSLRSATNATGRFGKPSKMEGISVLDKPALACKTKTCGACEACYARDNKMANNPSQARQYETLDKVLRNPTRVASGLDESLFDNARKFARGKNQPAMARYFAAGDGVDGGEFSMLSDVWNNQALWEKAGMSHWLSTRQYPALHDFFQARNWKKDIFPENVHLKVSLPGHETRDSMARFKGKHDDIIRDIISHPQISTTTYLDLDHKGEGMNVCPASHPDNPSKCEEVVDFRTGKVGCSACHSENDIAYLHHGPTMAQKKLQAQGLEAALANFNWRNDPEYKKKVLGRRVT